MVCEGVVIREKTITNGLLKDSWRILFRTPEDSPACDGHVTDRYKGGKKLLPPGGKTLKTAVYTSF